jgi:hypothetical protein
MIVLVIGNPHRFFIYTGPEKQDHAISASSNYALT